MNKEPISRQAILSLITDYCGASAPDRFLEGRLLEITDCWEMMHAFELYLFWVFVTNPHVVNDQFCGSGALNNGIALCNYEILMMCMDWISRVIHETRDDVETNENLERMWRERPYLVQAIMDSGSGCQGMSFDRIAAFSRLVNGMQRCIKTSNSSYLVDSAFAQESVDDLFTRNMSCLDFTSHPRLVALAKEKYGFDPKRLVDACRAWLVGNAYSPPNCIYAASAVHIVFCLADEIISSDEDMACNCLRMLGQIPFSEQGEVIWLLFFPNGLRYIEPCISVGVAYPNLKIIASFLESFKREVKFKAAIIKHIYRGEFFKDYWPLIDALDNFAHMQRASLRTSTPSFRSLVMAYTLI